MTFTNWVNEVTQARFYNSTSIDPIDVDSQLKKHNSRQLQIEIPKQLEGAKDL